MIVRATVRAAGCGAHGPWRRPARMAALALLGALGGCASPGNPPGGPPDAAAPQIVQVTPDTGAVNVAARRVVFRFDETVSERPAGAASLAGLFLVSPRDGEPEVRWRRSVVEVRPQRGFRRNTVYVVTMLPGVTDLRGNVRREGTSLVFSTGPSIPATRLEGLAFDWPAGTTLRNGIVEATSLPDSLTYVSLVDSAGRFTLRHLPPGRFVVRAYSDMNSNRVFDSRELFDTLLVTLADDSTGNAPVELLAFAHDTLGPRLAGVSVRDSVTLRVEFDKPLLPGDTLDVARFLLQREDSTPVAIARVEASRDAEARVARERAAADTMLRADSVDRERRADSNSVANAAQRQLPPNIRPPARPRTPPRDTVGAPRPSRPTPVRELVVTLGAPLTPASAFRLTARDARNLLGRAATSSRTFNTPRPAPRDTTRTAPREPSAPPVSAPPAPPAGPRRR